MLLAALPEIDTSRQTVEDAGTGKPCETDAGSCCVVVKGGLGGSAFLSEVRRASYITRDSFSHPEPAAAEPSDIVLRHPPSVSGSESKLGSALLHAAGQTLDPASLPRQHLDAFSISFTVRSLCALPRPPLPRRQTSAASKM